MMEESDSSRKESSITPPPPMKTGTTHVNEEREKVSPVISSSNAEPGYSKKSQNEDLINSISALINTRLTEFRSEMITFINKNGDQPMSLVFINSTENNNNGAVVGQKRPITNNDGGTNTQAKVPCCQNPAKTTSEDEVDLEILNQVYQEHQIPQNLGDAISERLSSVIKNTGHMNQKILAILENYMKNYKIAEIYAPLS